MPFYQKQGQFPHKRHTQFRKENGELYHEELFGTIGFDGMSSLLYHNHPPTMVKEVGESIDIAPKIAVEKNMKAYRLKGFDVKPTKDYLESRVPALRAANNPIESRVLPEPPFRAAMMKRGAFIKPLMAILSYLISVLLITIGKLNSKIIYRMLPLFRIETDKPRHAVNDTF